MIAVIAALMIALKMPLWARQRVGSAEELGTPALDGVWRVASALSLRRGVMKV